MRWVKNLSRKADPPTFERAVMTMCRARFGSMLSQQRMLDIKHSAEKRARREAGLV